MGNKPLHAAITTPGTEPGSEDPAVRDFQALRLRVPVGEAGANLLNILEGLALPFGSVNNGAAYPLKGLSAALHTIRRDVLRILRLRRKVDEARREWRNGRGATILVDNEVEVARIGMALTNGCAPAYSQDGTPTPISRLEVFAAVERAVEEVLAAHRAWRETQEAAAASAEAAVAEDAAVEAEKKEATDAKADHG